MWGHPAPGYEPWLGPVRALDDVESELDAGTARS